MATKKIRIGPRKKIEARDTTFVKRDGVWEGKRRKRASKRHRSKQAGKLKKGLKFANPAKPQPGKAPVAKPKAKWKAKRGYGLRQVAQTKLKRAVAVKRRHQRPKELNRKYIGKVPLGTEQRLTP